jgi:hypothetical protein
MGEGEMTQAETSRDETGPDGVRPDWSSVALAALLLAATAIYACARLFTQFSEYNDEGWMMISVKHFVDGHVLYDEIFTIYGPLYYMIAWLLHAVAGVPLTPDAIRFVSLTFWIATAGLTALCAWRLTRRKSLTSVVYFAMVFHLTTIINEPSHPQELCGLLLALCAAEAARAAPGQSLVPAIVGGAIAAGLALTKVNVGAFATLALLLAALAESGTGRAARIGRTIVGAVAVALPFLLMRADLGDHWTRNYALVVSLSTAMLLIAALIPAPPRAGPGLLVPMAAFAVAAAVPCLFVLARGTTLHGLIDCLLLRPSKMAEVFFWPPLIGRCSVAITVLALILALADARECAKGLAPSPRRNDMFALLKGLFGILVLLPLPHFTTLVRFGAPFLWLALRPPFAPVPGGGGSLSRLVLCFLAVLQTLIAYPVPGSQIAFGTFLLLPVAAACLGDALAWFGTRLGDLSIVKAILRAGYPLIAVVVLALAVNRAGKAVASYLDSTPVDLPGTRLIRLGERQTASYRWLVTNLNRSADSFLATIGFNTLYLWTGKEPPCLTRTTDEIQILSDDQQQTLIMALSRIPDACVIYHSSLFVKGLGDRYRPDSLLMDYVKEHFKDCGSVEGYHFLVKKGRPRPRLLDCARWEGETVRLDLASAPGRTVERLCLFDPDRQHIVADSHSTDRMAALRVADKGGRTLDLSSNPSSGIDLSSARSLTLSFVMGPGPARKGRSLIRLYDQHGRRINSVPFLDDEKRSPASVTARTGTGREELQMLAIEDGRRPPEQLGREGAAVVADEGDGTAVLEQGVGPAADRQRIVDVLQGLEAGDKR